MVICVRAGIIVALILSSIATAARAEAPAKKPTAAEAAVRRVLADQTDAWNRRDLTGFMRGYWSSPELRFYAGGTITKGWQETLDRYRRRYQYEGKEMGTLAMRDVEVEVLGPRHAMARGRWHLAFSEGRQAQGLFTLILEKMREGWRVIHDHSSSE